MTYTATAAETTATATATATTATTAAAQRPQLPAVLQQALAQAQEQGLPYAGSVAPLQAWQLVQQGLALLVDVRSAEERKFVGQVPGSAHVAWASGTALTRNPRFARELAALHAKQPQPLPVLLLCRSGKRSALAAQEAAKAGLPHVFNVSEGFEGDHDAQQQRGHFNGWRFYGLPWVQD
ncbi:rhodanese-like domain-containing protein [Comamonas sp. CMM03]|uniref:rhodanese-like domain-containing protein n=1 Tax=Comamonas sp. CMM03 TaxID=2854781 RepID=UPI001C45F12E|nr:rhodanese-like domain-containing protein [Comamonas sp. CMM03]MBV7419770.1 rhodanese-like domain-containing protein [Comamonas sp. CMM03]